MLHGVGQKQSWPAHLLVSCDFVPIVKRLGPPRRQGLCHPPALFWAVPILSPALQRRETPSRQVLCSRPPRLWASSDLVPRLEALGAPEAVGVM